MAPANAGGRGGAGGGFGGGRPPAWFSTANSTQILLADGKPTRMPTDDTTAIRHRILKAATVGKAGEGEIQLTLEVSLEPRLRWQQLVGVKVGKATDDRGQQLEQTTPAVGAPLRGAVLPPAPARPPGIGGGAGGMAPPRAVPGMPGGGVFAGPVTRSTDSRIQVAAVRLKKGAKAPTSLKELSGTVTARVLGEARALFSVPDVLEAAGKTVKGSEGGAIHVLAVDKERDNRYRLRLEVELPSGPLALVAGRDNRVFLEGGPADSAQHELTLLDRDGNRVQPVALRLSHAARKVELHVSYLARAGQGAPAKLVLSESKSVSVELPFTIRNVPLP
jgi:hypothetical protein